MMIPWDLIFNSGLGATLKTSNMAVIFKMVTGYYKILTTLYIAKWKCCWVNKSAIFGMMIPWEPIFHFGLGANLKKIQYGCHFQNGHQIL